MKQTLDTRDDIILLVDTFYSAVQQDELLAPIFNSVIKDQWPLHLKKMYSFWETVLLNDHTYLGSPFPPHARLPVTAEHFQRWLKLFKATMDNFFEGEKADEALWRAERMAELFLAKIEYFRNSDTTPLR